MTAPGRSAGSGVSTYMCILVHLRSAGSEEPVCTDLLAAALMYIEVQGASGRICSVQGVCRCLNIACSGAVCKRPCKRSVPCRHELSCLVDDIMNIAGICPAGDTVHYNRADRDLSLVRLVSSFAVDQG